MLPCVHDGPAGCAHGSFAELCVIAVYSGVLPRHTLTVGLNVKRLPEQPRAFADSKDGSPSACSSDAKSLDAWARVSAFYTSPTSSCTPFTLRRARGLHIGCGPERRLGLFCNRAPP